LRSLTKHFRANYQQVNALFDEVVGFDAFMLIFVNNLLRDNKYGMLFRVSCGAGLSMVDAATDLYVIATYVASERAGVRTKNEERSDDLLHTRRFVPRLFAQRAAIVLIANSLQQQQVL